MMIDLIIVLAIIVAVLYGLITGYREVEILIGRKSWYWIHFKRWLYWFTNQSGKNKDNDSFHFSNGTAFVIVALAFSYIIYLELNLSSYWILLNGVFLWLGMFYVRNVTMHCIIPKYVKNNPNLRLWYLIPLIGKFIQIKKEK